MQKVYFTFGSWEKFPHQNGYMVVIGEDFNDALAAYRAKYPDVTEACVNCSDFYDEKQWERVKGYYVGKEPKEVLVSDKYKANRLQVLLENALKLLENNDASTYVNVFEIGSGIEELELLGINVKEVTNGI